jgi:hypothetical protein
MVKACQDNVFSGTETFRLPKNQSEGHLPRIAMTRGKADSLECLMRRIGISDSEFTNPDGNGRINIFYETGGGTGYDSGTAFPLVSTLFNQTGPQQVRHDDHLVPRRERAVARAAARREADREDLRRRGRARLRVTLLVRLLPRVWPARPTRRTSSRRPGRCWPSGTATRDAPYTINTSFAKGMPFADWLVTVGASPTRGTITMTGVEGPAMSLYPGYNSQAGSRRPAASPTSACRCRREGGDADRAVRALRQHRHPRRRGGNGGPFPSQCGPRR